MKRTWRAAIVFVLAANGCGADDGLVDDVQADFAIGDDLDSPGCGCDRRLDGGGGAVTVLASNQPFIDGDSPPLVLDDESIYWAAAGNLMKTDKLGHGQPIVLATQAGGDVTGLVVGTTQVYYIGNSALMSVPKTGGTPQMIAANAISPAVDATNLYWTVFTPTSTVMKQSLADGSISVLADQTDRGVGTASAINVYGRTVYWIGGDSLFQLYLFSIDRDGGPITEIGPVSNLPYITVDAEYAYQVNEGGYGSGCSLQDAIFALPLGGGSFQMFGVLVSFLDLHLAVDDQYLYSADLWGGRILRTSKVGGVTTVLASGQCHPQNVAVDSGGIYWLNYDGQISRVALP